MFGGGGCASSAASPTCAAPPADQRRRSLPCSALPRSALRKKEQPLESLLEGADVWLGLPACGVSVPAMGDEEEEAEEFQRHWRLEFPGEEAPALPVGSVPAMEEELDRCRRSLQRLQRSLAEERFKVGYLEALLARQTPTEPPPPPPRPCAPSRHLHQGAPTAPLHLGGSPGDPQSRHWRRHRQRDLPDGCSSPEPPTRSPPQRQRLQRDSPGCCSDPGGGGGGGTPGGSSDWSCNSSDHEDASSAGGSWQVGRPPNTGLPPAHGEADPWRFP